MADDQRIFLTSGSESPGTQLAVIPEPPTLLQTKMAAIEAEIACHYDQIALLKAKRNAMAPICSLPNELMTRILTIFAVETESLFNLKWTEVMYVCHRWHELALAAQPLWGFIDASYDPESRLIIQLRHSGAAPLHLKLQFFDKPYYADYVLENSERIAQLEVGGEAQHVYELIGRLLDFRFPILYSLSFDPSYKHDELPEDFVQALPVALLDGRLPKLRDLTLTSIAFPWTSLSGLESLSLSQCNDSSGCPLPPFRVLLQMLSACPQLLKLKLDLCIPPPIPNQLYATVHLPALAWLSLRDHAYSCEELLNHLRIPPATSIQILFYDVRNGADIRNALVPLRKHMRAPTARKPLLLQINRTSASYCTMSLFCDTAPHDPFERHTVQCLLALNSHPETEGALRQILTKVLHAVPSDSITHVDSRAGSALREVSWLVLIKLLPSLEAVYLQVNEGAVNCIHALTHREVQGAQNRPLPRIRRIHILIFQLETGDNTMAVLMAALEAYLQVCASAPDLVVFEDRHHTLAASVHQATLERLFGLMEGEIVWNGVVYDPVKRRELRERRAAERRALMIKYGMDIEDD
ncbi:hypothetical protein DFH06DRAFT_1297355 [Mycena polygramma]|nr:hypothetical protein DFH06DRAFT_1297355 [Mycena polygramma]